MEKLNSSSKIISIYSNIPGDSGRGYAVNLATGLSRVTGVRIALFAKELTVDPKIGIDVLELQGLDNKKLEQIKNTYQYVIIDLPSEIDEAVYRIFSFSDTIHFFVDSSKDSLKKAHEFLEDLIKKGLTDIHDKFKIVVNRLNIFDKFSVEEMSWLLKRDVWTLVPESDILEPAIDSKGMPLILRSEDSRYSKAILRIAKKESGKLLGLALGSGGAFGLAHIGVLRVLEQNLIPIDAISGSSIGALIASMLGLGFSSDKIERIAKKLKNRLNVIRLLDFTIPISGILAGKRIKRFLKSFLREKTFEDLEIPVKIMVYDLANRETLSIEKGLLVEAVYRSIAIPGILKPKVEKERMFVDGGVSDPVPVDILLKDGIKKIIAVNVLPGPEDIYKRNMKLKKIFKKEENLMQKGPFYVKMITSVKTFFRQVFTPNIFDVIMTSMQAIEYMLAEASCKKVDVTLRPVLSEASSIDFHLVKDFVKRGEEEANLHLNEIKVLVVR